MSIKAKAPKEDPETKARREAAEARADESRISSTQDLLDEETRKRLRRFGSRAALGGLSSFSSFAAALGRGGLSQLVSGGVGGGGFRSPAAITRDLR